jgi:bifunctional DNA-binding transcriptional regulator/antitoxin component of YhaV-PrlF toxin-antitoxin module
MVERIEAEMNVKLSLKGCILIPAALRMEYGLIPGANLQVVEMKPSLSIRSANLLYLVIILLIVWIGSVV